MTLVRRNSSAFLFRTIINSRVRLFITPVFSILLILFLLSGLSGCSTYVASKQDDVATQIDVWSAQNEYGKAFETLSYVKPSHPQYSQMLARKKSLQTEALDYEVKIDKKIVQLIDKKQWAEALDLLELAQKKYPQGKTLRETEKHLQEKQKQQLAIINQDIMLERSRWMTKTRPIYQLKLNTDPRNSELKAYLDDLNRESETLARKLTLLAKQAIASKHYKTARRQIDLALALAPNNERRKILSSLKDKEKKTYHKKKRAQKLTHKKQQNTLLLDIEKSFKSGNLLKTRQLISRLDDKERQHPELIQLEQELDRSINYAIQRFFSDANKLYTDGQFEKAIALWAEVLLYDPQNELAKENIQRAEKVINKLSTLREKQKE